MGAFIQRSDDVHVHVEMDWRRCETQTGPEILKVTYKQLQGTAAPYFCSLIPRINSRAL